MGLKIQFSITSFREKYRFLSNFYPVTVEFEGTYYPSVEHAYQAAKTVIIPERSQILWAKSPGAAKRYGRRLPLRPDWNEVRLPIMEELLRKKFSQEPLKTMLLKTKNRKLVEGNTWGDTFWGRCAGLGENHLGRLLMKIREELGDGLEKPVQEYQASAFLPGK